MSLTHTLTALEPGDTPLSSAPEGWFQGPQTHYMLLDAGRLDAVMGDSNVPALAAGLRCQSLFHKEDLATVAPWLIELPLEAEATESLLGTYFSKLFGKRVGLLLRSDASFYRLLSHLRTFTMVRTGDGPKETFFRYWDPMVASIYFPGIATRAERTDRLLWTADGQAVGLLVEESGESAHILAPEGPAPAAGARDALRLDDADRALLDEVVYKALAGSLADWFRTAFPGGISDAPDAQRAAAAQHVVEVGRGFGFTLKDEFSYLAHIMAHFGGWFFEIDATSTLTAILRDQTVPKRHRALEAVFAEAWAAAPQAALLGNLDAIRAAVADQPPARPVTADLLRDFGEAYLPHAMEAVRATEIGARAAAQANEGSDRRAHLLLSLTLGHRYHDDPFRPWCALPFAEAQAAAWAFVFE